MNYDVLKLFAASVATIGLYTVLYKENKFYRFWEHVFVGLATGYSIVAIWTEVLKGSWWDRMIGVAATLPTPENPVGEPAKPGYWLYAFLLPIGLMGYTIFSRKHNWISRIPIGIILGLYSGQQFGAWQTRYLPQVVDSAKPILPSAGASFFQPDATAIATLSPEAQVRANSLVYGSQALSNFIFVVTLLSVVSYFLFSFDVRSKVLAKMTGIGRWLLMIGFGAIFGSTVMMRFTLLIDRMYFIWIELVRDGIWHGLLHR